MGKKNSNVKKNGESKGPSSSVDIFKTLFGEITEKGPSSSIFSDDNPFRRKPSDPSQTPQHNQQPNQLGFRSVENEESPENGKVQNPNAVEGKKRKRIKEKDEVSDIELASLGEGSVAPLEISKLKKKTKSSVESENFGSESKALSKKEKGKNHLGKDAREDLNLGRTCLVQFVFGLIRFLLQKGSAPWLCYPLCLQATSDAEAIQTYNTRFLCS